MQVFMEILAKSRKLPLAGYDSRSNREVYVRSLIEGGLTAFSSVLNQERIYLPTRYTFKISICNTQYFFLNSIVIEKFNKILKMFSTNLDNGDMLVFIWTVTYFHK